MGSVASKATQGPGSERKEQPSETPAAAHAVIKVHPKRASAAVPQSDVGKPVGADAFPGEPTSANRQECKESQNDLPADESRNQGPMADNPYCTTRELVEGVLKPHASNPETNHYALMPDNQLQPPKYYVCHAWDRPFRDLMECLRMHFPGDKKGLIVWIDIFCLDQGSSEPGQAQEPSLQLLSAVQSVAQSTLLILDPEGLCFKRLWCLHEQNTAAAAGSGLLCSLEILPHLLGKPDFATVAEALCSLDASAAQASLAEDKAAILKRISTSVTGDVSHFNASLKKALVDLLAQLLEKADLPQRPGLLGLAKEILHIDHVLGAPLVEPVMQCVVEARRRISTERQDNGVTLANMALLMRAKGNLESSEQMFRVALEKAKAYFGVSHHHTVTVRMQLACLLKSKGGLSESVTLYQDALESRRKELGDRDPGVATILNNLGDLRGMQGHLKHADALLREALSIRLDVYGGWHRITAMSMHSLAVLLMKTASKEDLSNARALLHRVLDVRKHMHGSEHEDTVACSKSLQELATLELSAEAKERVMNKRQHMVRLVPRGVLVAFTCMARHLPSFPVNEHRHLIPSPCAFTLPVQSHQRAQDEVRQMWNKGSEDKPESVNKVSAAVAPRLQEGVDQESSSYLCSLTAVSPHDLPLFVLQGKHPLLHDAAEVGEQRLDLYSLVEKDRIEEEKRKLSLSTFMSLGMFRSSKNLKPEVEEPSVREELAPKASALHGIKIRWFLHFAAGVFENDMSHSPSCTTREVVEAVIKPDTLAQGCSYAQLPDVALKQADSYVSHSWDRPFRELVESLRQYYSGREEEGAVWIDFMCSNQHIAEPESRVSVAGAVQQRLSRTLLIMDPDGSCLQSLRCLNELHGAMRASQFSNRHRLEVMPFLLDETSAEVIGKALGSLDLHAVAEACEDEGFRLLLLNAMKDTEQSFFRIWDFEKLSGMLADAALEAVQHMDGAVKGRRERATVMVIAGGLLQASGRPKLAEPLLRRALDERIKLVGNHRSNIEIVNQLSQVLVATGDSAGAAQLMGKKQDMSCWRQQDPYMQRRRGVSMDGYPISMGSGVPRTKGRRAVLDIPGRISEDLGHRNFF